MLYPCSVCSGRAVWATEATSRSVCELGAEARLAAVIPSFSGKGGLFSHPPFQSAGDALPLPLALPLPRLLGFLPGSALLLFRMNNNSSHLSRSWGSSRNYFPALSTLPGSAAGAGRSFGLGITFNSSTRKQKYPTVSLWATPNC